MSWARKKLEQIAKDAAPGPYHLHLGSREIVTRAIRETIEECAKHCRNVVDEYATGKLHTTKWTGHEAEARILAMLRDDPEG